ncbi:MAG: hypothetical protein GY847_09375 [Proteobacteria bacterium]|nr:hypothetical protein [Pseudomonadota bacterium]
MLPTQKTAKIEFKMKKKMSLTLKQGTLKQGQGRRAQWVAGFDGFD